MKITSRGTSKQMSYLDYESELEGLLWCFVTKIHQAAQGSELYDIETQINPKL